MFFFEFQTQSINLYMLAQIVVFYLNLGNTLDANYAPAKIRLDVNCTRYYIFVKLHLSLKNCVRQKQYAETYKQT
jgi:hypothetical protein